jgi:hypothetical protein
LPKFLGHIAFKAYQLEHYQNVLAFGLGGNSYNSRKVNSEIQPYTYAFTALLAASLVPNSLLTIATYIFKAGNSPTSWNLSCHLLR